MKQIKVDVLFFGLAKELCAAKRVTLEVGEGSTLDFCRQKIEAEFPRLTQLQCAYAINKSYVNDGSCVLSDGDELAVLPPVSGG